MITFSFANTIFKHCGLVLFCLQLLLFIACLEPFHAGTWFQTEPAMVVMFFLSTLSSLWLTMGISKNWLTIEHPVHPLLYGLLAWSGWQFIALPFSENPLHSWMGIAQTGEGSAWQVMLLLSVAVAMPVWKSNLYKKIILSVAATSLMVMTCLHFNPETLCNRELDNYGIDNPKAPANWPDYLPFISGWLWIAYASTPSIRTPSRHFWMIVIFSIVLLVGQNSTARILMFPAIIAFSLLLLLQLYRRKSLWGILSPAGRNWKFLAALGTIMPVIWIIVSQQADQFPCKKSAFAVRAIYNQVAIAAIVDNPTSILMGKGWRDFGSDMLKYGMVDGLTSFQNGIFSPNSLWLYGNVSHPHSQPIEALLAVGICGLIIFMTLPILAIWPLRRTLFWWCVPVFLVLNAMGYLWFNIPQTLAFQALGLTALCAGRKACTHLSTAIIPRCFSAICLVLAMLFTASTLYQMNIINYGERLKNIMREDPNQVGIIDWMAQDIPRGGERMTTAIRHFSQNIVTRVNANATRAEDHDWYRNFLEVVNRATMYNVSNVKLAKLELDIAMLPFSFRQNSPLDDLRPEIRKNLLDIVMHITTLAPQREDFIAPFLESLDGFTNGDTTKQREILENILKVTPNHRSTLWLLGTLNEDIEMKKLAVKLGVDRVYPVTKEELSPY